MGLHRQRGITTVEFAIVGLLFFVLLFAVIEFGRLIFVWNSLNEATRRGARVAVVCPVNHSAIARVAVFNAADGGAQSSILPDLRTDHITVRYLNAAGTVLTSPMVDYDQIRHVEVAVSGYTHRFLLPLYETTFSAPDFRTTLPRESLGLARGDTVPICFGTSS